MVVSIKCDVVGVNRHVKEFRIVFDKKIMIPAEKCMEQNIMFLKNASAKGFIGQGKNHTLGRAGLKNTRVKVTTSNI